MELGPLQNPHLACATCNGMEYLVLKYLIRLCNKKADWVPQVGLGYFNKFPLS